VYPALTDAAQGFVAGGGKDGRKPAREVLPPHRRGRRHLEPEWNPTGASPARCGSSFAGVRIIPDTRRTRRRIVQLVKRDSATDICR